MGRQNASSLMATKKSAAAKVVNTVSPDPEQQEDGGQNTPATDVDVFVAETADADPAAGGGTGTGTGTGGGAPAGGGGGAPAVVAAPVNKPSYATTVVPAPAAATAAPKGSSGQLMGIQLGVETKAQHNARLGAGAGTCGDIGWLLGTVA
jgi:hypothetical protein